MSDVLRFDLAKEPNGNPITYGRVGDGGSFYRRVQIFENGKPLDLTGWTATFEGNTPKYKTKVFDSDGISITNAKKGEFTYTFPNMAFAVEGQYERAYFSFIKGNQRKSTGNFEIIVFGNADIDAPEAETIITEYNKLVTELRKLQDQAIANMNQSFAEINVKIAALEVALSNTEKKINQALQEFSNGNFYTRSESDNRFAKPTDITKVNAGLGNVDNFGTATQLEAESGTSTNKFMTPSRTKQQVTSRIASQSEAEIGTSSEKLMTPFGTKKFYLNETKVRRQKWDDGLNWVAHRGNNTEYPENSIAAFKNAHKHFGIETDIQVTSDGKWVVMHDSTVDRTTNGTGAVSSMTLAQFRALRIDTGANLSALTDAEKTPPTLEEYLIICKQLNKVPIIEIKSGSYSTANYTLLKDTLNLFGYDESNCVIASFSYAVLTNIRAIYPNMELHMFFNSIDTNTISQLTTIGIPAVASCSYSNASMNAENVRLLHAAGFKVGVWTVPDASFETVIKLGVDYITTNSLSGNLKYQALTLQNGFSNGTDNGLIKESYVEEVGGSAVHLNFNVAGGVTTQNSPIATLPEWAVPMYRQYSQCSIRVSAANGNVIMGTFDVNGRLAPYAETMKSLSVGLNWANKTTWAAGSTVYKV